MLKECIYICHRTCLKDKNNLVTKAAFALADPSLSAPFFRSAGGLFENMYRWFFYYVGQGPGGFFNSVSHKLCEHVFADGWSILEKINDSGPWPRQCPKRLTPKSSHWRDLLLCPPSQDHIEHSRVSVQQLMTLDAPNFRRGLRQRNRHILPAAAGGSRGSEQRLCDDVEVIPL